MLGPKKEHDRRNYFKVVIKERKFWESVPEKILSMLDYKGAYR